MDISKCIPDDFYITWINGKCYRVQYLYDYTFVMYHKKEPICKMVLNKLFDYSFIPSARERTQENMESRALHLILRRLIGDETFTW
jgi:hypothetical protein